MNLQSAAPSAAKRHSVELSIWPLVLALVLALCMLVAQILGSAPRAHAANFEGYLWPNQPSSGCCLYFSWAVYPGDQGAATWVFDYAANAWNQSPANVSMYKYSPTTGGVDDVVSSYYNSNDNRDAFTLLNTSGYYFVQPQHSLVNDYWIWGYTTAEAQGTAAHEFGHAIGLAHNGPVYPCSSGEMLMDQYQIHRWGDCHINTPQSDDINGVNSFY